MSDQKETPATNAAHSNEKHTKFDAGHPVWRAVAFFVLAAAAITYLVRTGASAIDWLSPRTIRIEGDTLTAFDSSGKQVLSRRFGPSQNNRIYRWTPIDADDRRSGVILSHGDRSQNACFVAKVSGRGSITSSYRFDRENPYPDTFYDFECGDLISFEYNGRRHYAGVFFGQRYPTAIVIFDANLNIVAESWHPGHIYDIAWLDDPGLLVGWGKNNSFQRAGIDDQPNDATNPSYLSDRFGTTNHTCVFAIDFIQFLGDGTKSVGVHGQRKTTPTQSDKTPYPTTPYAWYYIFSDPNSDFSTAELQLKPNDGVVQFIDRSHLVWRFNHKGLEGPPGLLPGWPRPADVTCIEIVPVDHSGECAVSSDEGH
ncbi:MAG: hypothetical protein KDA16_00490 [Phycisphaerales bacterium]|nr:hypothetical protein [Phycisphaerales bacterium]